MAGIGFQLRRIIDSERGLLHSIKSYGYAVFIINGPMILCITAVSIVQFILGRSGYSGISSDKILMTITFAFVISTMLTAGYTLVLTRYVSDCIYERTFDKVIPSLYGAMVIAGIFSIVFTLALVVLTRMKLEYAVPLSALYAIVNIIYLEMIYLSAVRNYKAIVKGFMGGNTLSVILIIFVRYIDQKWALQYILFCFNTGFAITAGLLLYQIRRPFGEGSGSFMEWTKYFKKYPSLALSGLFYYTSLYFVCFYYRFIDHNGFIEGFLTMKPDFDIPFYFAVLGLIPSLVYFTVRFETSLHTSYQEFFSAIANGTYAEIDFKLQSLVMTVKYRYIRMVSVVVGVLLLMLLLPFALMHADHLTFRRYILYWLLAVALSATLLMYVSNIVVLYFDARGYSLIINFVYLGLNIALTLFVDSNLVGLRGFGFMVASVLSMLLALMLMLYLLRNLKNYAFIMRDTRQEHN